MALLSPPMQMLMSLETLWQIHLEIVFSQASGHPVAQGIGL